MNKLTSTLLLVGISLLTVFSAFGKLTPVAWLLVYAGWLMLAQYHARRFLEEQRAARAESRDPPATPTAAQPRPLPAAPTRALPQRRTPAAD